MSKANQNSTDKVKSISMQEVLQDLYKREIKSVEETIEWFKTRLEEEQLKLSIFKKLVKDEKSNS